VDINYMDALTGRPWLVEARNAVQSLMLGLYETFSATLELADKDAMRERHLQLGAAFSLWRAVFLIRPDDAGRKLEEIDSDARSFLERVIDTNMITFGDDLRWGVWSGGYYLNNARDRIAKLCPDGNVPQSIADKVLKNAWNDLYRVLSKSVSASHLATQQRNRSEHD